MGKKQIIDLSIVIPCYNEGNKIIYNINSVMEYMEKYKNLTYEIIIVNDGSYDNTEAVLKKINEPNIRIISYIKNRGKGYAVKTGILNSTGTTVLFMDADLSTDLSAIEIVLDSKDKYDVIIGSRKNQKSVLVKKQGILRRIIGNSCSKLTNLIIPLKIEDTQCGFKSFNGNLIRKFCEMQKVDGFAFDVELLYMARINKKEIYEFGVIWENDMDSRVTVIKSSVLFLLNLIYIRLNKNKYILK